MEYDMRRSGDTCGGTEKTKGLVWKPEGRKQLERLYVDGRTA
jgi:hypothetical protein